jgi:hypothetical protein
VGKDFSTADKGKTFKRGGDMATKKMNPFAKFEKSGKDVEKKGMKEGSKADMALDKKQMMGMKKGGMKKMAAGGMTESMGPRSMSSDVEKGSNKKAAHGEHAVQKKGHTKGKQIVMSGNKGMKRGGKVC